MPAVQRDPFEHDGGLPPLLTRWIAVFVLAQWSHCAGNFCDLFAPREPVAWPGSTVASVVPLPDSGTAILTGVVAGGVADREILSVDDGQIATEAKWRWTGLSGEDLVVLPDGTWSYVGLGVLDQRYGALIQTEEKRSFIPLELNGAKAVVVAVPSRDTRAVILRWQNHRIAAAQLDTDRVVRQWSIDAPAVALSSQATWSAQQSGGGDLYTVSSEPAGSRVDVVVRRWRLNEGVCPDPCFADVLRIPTPASQHLRLRTALGSNETMAVLAVELDATTQSRLAVTVVDLSALKATPWRELSRAPLSSTTLVADGGQYVAAWIQKVNDEKRTFATNVDVTGTHGPLVRIDSQSTIGVNAVIVLRPEDDHIRALWVSPGELHERKIPRPFVGYEGFEWFRQRMCASGKR